MTFRSHMSVICKFNIARVSSGSNLLRYKSVLTKIFCNSLILKIWKPEVKGENDAASVCRHDLNEKNLTFLKRFKQLCNQEIVSKFHFKY